MSFDGEVPTGCAALHEIAPGIGEVKRVYVVPEFRGRGIARALSERVVTEARIRGYIKLRLGTLTRMHVAQKLYARLGFKPIPPYRVVEFGDTLFYELSLEPMLDGALSSIFP